MLHLYDSESRVKHLMDLKQFKDEDKKGIDVPFFDLEDILAATDNFSDSHKLGQGGFGPVYKVIEIISTILIFSTGFQLSLSNAYTLWLLGQISRWERNSCEEILKLG